METQQLALEGQKTARDILRREPQLLQEDQVYWLAYYDLRTDQPLSGMGGVGPIPWTAINEFGKRYDIEGEQFDRMKDMIRFIEVQDKRITESQKGKTPTK